MKIKAFHIDMNNAQFTRGYLEHLLTGLASLGYNTIIWEVEDNIAWDTCPECVSPEAFTKKEFQELLSFSRKLGLEPVGLLQTLGHCEYVLKNEEYEDLAELPNRVDQYCPLNEKLSIFLNRWIEEYLEVFGDVKYLHLGADEAWILGACDSCKEYVRQNSIEELYLQHLEKIAAPLIDRGIRPMIWADMPLRYPGILDSLNRSIILCDWMYEVYHGRGKVYSWTDMRLESSKEFKQPFLQRFGKYLFPSGQIQNDEPNIFYTSDYLCEMGFDVLECPSSSSYGDSVFAPRLWVHLQNCFDLIKKGHEHAMAGFVLTSWTCHLFPYILQDPCFKLVKYISENPSSGLDEYKDYYVFCSFGVSSGADFWDGTEAFSNVGLFMQNHSLGIGKNPGKVNNDFITKQLQKISQQQNIDSEIARAETLIDSYGTALEKLERFAKKISKGHDIIEWWVLAGRNQLNRAEVSLFLLQAEKGILSEKYLNILDEMMQLRKLTDKKLSTIIKSARRAQMIHWLYDSCSYAMEKVVSATTDIAAV